MAAEHLRAAYELFYDVRRSVDLLERHGAEYMFHTGGYVGATTGGAVGAGVVEAAPEAAKPGRKRGRAAKIDDED